MKVGTDAVLLAAWTDMTNATSILDIGTGCGVIALICAQRTPKAHIHAIDIDRASVQEAEANFMMSPWSERLIPHHGPLQSFPGSPGRFDLLISNPPYFLAGQSSPAKARGRARHTSHLAPDDFFLHSTRLLNTNGRLSVILPEYRHEFWIETAGSHGLFPSRICRVFSYPGKSGERILAEFCTKQVSYSEESLFIRKGQNMPYSDTYIELTRDLYLWK